MVEVAKLFAGIFLTIIPAIAILRAGQRRRAGAAAWRWSPAPTDGPTTRCTSGSPARCRPSSTTRRPTSCSSTSRAATPVAADGSARDDARRDLRRRRLHGREHLHRQRAELHGEVDRRVARREDAELSSRTSAGRLPGTGARSTRCSRSRSSAEPLRTRGFGSRSSPGLLSPPARLAGSPLQRCRGSFFALIRTPVEVSRPTRRIWSVGGKSPTIALGPSTPAPFTTMTAPPSSAPPVPTESVMAGDGYYSAHSGVQRVAAAPGYPMFERAAAEVPLPSGWRDADDRRLRLRGRRQRDGAADDRHPAPASPSRRPAHRSRARRSADERLRIAVRAGRDFAFELRMGNARASTATRRDVRCTDRSCRTGASISAGPRSPCIG